MIQNELASKARNLGDFVDILSEMLEWHELRPDHMKPILMQLRTVLKQ